MKVGCCLSTMAKSSERLSEPLFRGKNTSVPSHSPSQWLLLSEQSDSELGRPLLIVGEISGSRSLLSILELSGESAQNVCFVCQRVCFGPVVDLGFCAPI